MRLIVEITYRDDKVEIFKCVDFPTWGNDFLTLYLPGFERKSISFAGISAVRQYFKK